MYGESEVVCRLFGMLSTKKLTASKYLLDDPCSIYVQSSVSPTRLQGDGWGIGYYTNGHARLVKSEKPVYEEHERFAAAVRLASSTIVLAHVRRASNPRGLAKERMISIENSQPFSYRRYIFVHNGTITIPDEVAETLDEWKDSVRGLNDSEVYFSCLMKEIADGATIPNAIMKFRDTLSEVWQESRHKHPDKHRPYIGLNMLLSDGERLYAYCKYDNEDKSVKSLCFGDQPVFQMAYLSKPTLLVVASEKTNREDNWKPLRSGQLLIGEVAEAQVRTSLQ